MRSLGADYSTGVTVKQFNTVLEELQHGVLGSMDAGIAGAVKILLENGVEAFESCEGGSGHAFPEPTVRFHGNVAAGPKALSVCMDYGLPVLELRRVWCVQDHEMTGPKWELVFRNHVPLR